MNSLSWGSLDGPKGGHENPATESWAFKEAEKLRAKWRQEKKDLAFRSLMKYIFHHPTCPANPMSLHWQHGAACNCGLRELIERNW
jgi:hypothetical protein